MGKKVENFDIKLGHPNIALNLNNVEDSENIDIVLSKLIKKKDDQSELIEILSNTSMKYLKRLQDDGLLIDSKDSNVVPIYEPRLTEKAIEFYNSGGYSALFEKDKNKSTFSKSILEIIKKVLIGLLIGIGVWLITQFVLIPIFVNS